MTSKVIADAHSVWALKVEAIDTDPHGATAQRELAIVAPGEKQEFAVFQGRQILITEMPNK